jgi:hypothetical protein
MNEKLCACVTVSGEPAAWRLASDHAEEATSPIYRVRVVGEHDNHVLPEEQTADLEHEVSLDLLD